MPKALKRILLLSLVAAIGWFGWKWYRAQHVSEDAFAMIPPHAIYCISTSDPIQTWKDVSTSNVWMHLQKNAYFASLTSSANSLDSLVRENDFLFDLIGSHALLASAHMTGAKEYDFLFVVDLREVAGIKILNEYLSTFTTAGYSFRKEKHGDEDIITLHNPEKGTTFYMSFPGSSLIISFTKKLITTSLDTRESNKVKVVEAFNKTADGLETDGFIRLYLNYKMLPQLMGCYSNDSNEYIKHLSTELTTTGLSMILQEDIIKARGYTYVNDSVESYVKTLAISGKGVTEITEIAPQRTAFYLGFGFSTFAEFFNNFEKNLQKDVTEYKAYRSNLQQVENYLGISLKKEFIDWIGDEVALFELQSSGKGTDTEVALVLKAYDIEKAKKDLAHIEKMVRRKTPVKFKKVNHKGYTIDYLSMKGLFKVLLGKFFARYDKPYYTVINNFVIFSNHPQTLESIIDDYLSKNTLIRSAEFREFRKEFDDEGSVFVYVNTPVLFNTMKKLADGPTKASMEASKEYIVCFKQVAFQLVPETGRFKTLFAEHFVGPPPAPEQVAAVERIDPGQAFEADSVTETLAADAGAEVVSGEDPMALPYIYVQDLNASEYIVYFADSTVNYKVKLENGFKDGLFTEYYPDGTVRMKGHFKKDHRDGTWRLYDEIGKLIMKRHYKDDEVTREKIKD